MKYDLRIATTESDPEAPLTTLRNARGEADPRRVRNIAVGLCLAALASTSVVLFVVGAHQNGQISALKKSGVQVVETVTGCQGLLGGSGSNGAGYSCKGTVTLNGRTYNDSVPDNLLYPPGAKVKVVVDSQNPGLVASIATVKNEHASNSVYVLPTILLVAFLALGAIIGIRFRKRLARPPRAHSRSLRGVPLVRHPG
jgi:hypothetical protein